MGPYNISKQDMALDLSLTRNRCYVSIEDMEVYTAATAATIPDKIDLVYHWRETNSSGVEFGHSFVSPVSDAMYMPSFAIPTELYKRTKIKKGGVKDAHLARLDQINEVQPGTYVDDIDFERMGEILYDMPDYALGFLKEGGFWCETEDGKYRAMIYINSTGLTSGCVISMKRYQMY
jgi:hypothetical protein